MNKLIQDNWARLNPTAGPRDRRFPSESLLTDEPGISRTLSFESIVRDIPTAEKKQNFLESDKGYVPSSSERSREPEEKER